MKEQKLIAIKEVQKSPDGKWLNITSEDGVSYAGLAAKLPDISDGGDWMIESESKEKRNKPGEFWNSISRMWQEKEETEKIKAEAPPEPLKQAAPKVNKESKNRAFALSYSKDLGIPLVAATGQLPLSLVYKIVQIADIFNSYLEGEETTIVLSQIKAFIEAVKHEADAVKETKSEKKDTDTGGAEAKGTVAGAVQRGLSPVRKAI